MQWLREHMRNHIGEAALEPTEKVLSFRRAPAGPAKQQQDTEAVDLVYQAADVVRGVQDRAAQIEARAEDLVRRAIEKLQIAENRIRTAEVEQRAAEAGLNEAGARIHATEKALQTRPIPYRGSRSPAVRCRAARANRRGAGCRGREGAQAHRARDSHPNPR